MEKKMDDSFKRLQNDSQSVLNQIPDLLVAHLHLSASTTSKERSNLPSSSSIRSVCRSDLHSFFTTNHQLTAIAAAQISTKVPSSTSDVVVVSEAVVVDVADDALTEEEDGVEDGVDAVIEEVEEEEEEAEEVAADSSVEDEFQVAVDDVTSEKKEEEEEKCILSKSQVSSGGVPPSSIPELCLMAIADLSISSLTAYDLDLDSEFTCSEPLSISVLIVLSSLKEFSKPFSFKAQMHTNCLLKCLIMLRFSKRNKMSKSGSARRKKVIRNWKRREKKLQILLTELEGKFRFHGGSIDAFPPSSTAHLQLRLAPMPILKGQLILFFLFPYK